MTTEQWNTGLIEEKDMEEISKLPLKDILVIIKNKREDWPLGEFPHILEKLEFFWGEPEMVDYMQSLTDDKRSALGKGFRQGFPLSVLTDLQTLIDIHTKRWPHIILVGTIAFTCG